MLIVHTKVFLEIEEDAHRAEELADLLQSASEQRAVSTVVVAEVRIALPAGPRRDPILRQLVESQAFITPLHSDWQQAADGLRALGGDDFSTGRSFWNDLLIATSCVRVGAVLLTSKAEDFRRIKRVVPVRTVALWRN